MKISRFNVAAVIFDDKKRVLVCKRSRQKEIAPGKWRLPGGEIEKEEMPVEALKRELSEELSVDTVQVVETPIKHIYEIGEEAHQTQYFYAVIKGDIKLNFENDEFVYVNLDNISHYIESDHLSVNKKAIEWCSANI